MMASRSAAPSPLGSNAPMALPNRLSLNLGIDSLGQLGQGLTSLLSLLRGARADLVQRPTLVLRCRDQRTEMLDLTQSVIARCANDERFVNCPKQRNDLTSHLGVNSIQELRMVGGRSSAIHLEALRDVAKERRPPRQQWSLSRR